MITFTKEKLAVALRDVKRLLPAHFEYVGDHDLPIDPAWSVYNALEAKDCAALFMVRNDDHAIGYAAAIYHPHLSSQCTWVGTIPTWFVQDCAARASIARSLIRTAQTWCLAKGAKQVFIRTRYQQSAGRLMELMGFVPDEIGYKMALSPGISAGEQQ